VVVLLLLMGTAATAAAGRGSCQELCGSGGDELAEVGQAGASGLRTSAAAAAAAAPSQTGTAAAFSVMGSAAAL